VAGLVISDARPVIGLARLHGLIPSAREVFEQLLHGGFRIAPEVIGAVLERVGES